MTAAEVAKVARLLDYIEAWDKKASEHPGDHVFAVGIYEGMMQHVRIELQKLIGASPLVRMFGARAVAGTHRDCGGSLIPSAGGVLWCERCGATEAAS
ncbi:MAG: hypothetical protein JO086_00145 [Acidimicrobiia bacterium]|nr:hypothetical protein [Acidimicrobiia bacterium]